MGADAVCHVSSRLPRSAFLSHYVGYQLPARRSPAHKQRERLFSTVYAWDKHTEPRLFCSFDFKHTLAARNRLSYAIRTTECRSMDSTTQSACLQPRDPKSVLREQHTVQQPRSSSDSAGRLFKLVHVIRPFHENIQPGPSLSAASWVRLRKVLTRAELAVRARVCAIMVDDPHVADQSDRGGVQERRMPKTGMGERHDGRELERVRKRHSGRSHRHGSHVCQRTRERTCFVPLCLPWCTHISRLAYSSHCSLLVRLWYRLGCLWKRTMYGRSASVRCCCCIRACGCVQAP